jgi:amino acid permease
MALRHTDTISRKGYFPEEDIALSHSKSIKGKHDLYTRQKGSLLKKTCPDISSANLSWSHTRAVKEFSVFSLLGISFSLANSLFGISTALVTGINSGGPVKLVYDIILISIVCAAIVVSLSELASAMPDAGGQSFWTS